MDRIWIVIKSEYLRRVKSKAFILTTLLLPLAIALLLVIVIVLSVSALDDDQQRTVAVVDRTGLLLEDIEAASDDEYRFVRAAVPVDSLREAVTAGQYNGYLLLPEGLVEGNAGASYYALEGGGTLTQERLRDRIADAVRTQRLSAQQVDPSVLELINARVPLRMVKLTEEGEEAGNTDFFLGLGFAMGFMIFMMMLIYGTVVMQGVIEEKTSRVVEVIVSSVKPFQLMMGKVIAIGAMGLTQILAWSVLLFAGSIAVGFVMFFFIDPATLPTTVDPNTVPDIAELTQTLEAAGIAIPTIPPSIFFWFVLYFLFGYLLYASLYAAVGSLVESQQDAQGFLLPIMLPIIISMYTLVPQIERPHSTLAVALSMIPLTSPISMIVRTSVTDVPLWQMGVSLLLLVGGFLAGTWLSARIYRIGILMYGKKPKPRELLRWIRYS
jgi:ABC-2 type transport system permease protein